MSFSWGTKTEEEANAAKPSIQYIDGDYPFKVYAAESMVSPTSGNNYILIKTKVFLPSGSVYCDDKIVDVPSMFFKRKHFWESVGFPEKINSPDYAYVGMEGNGRYKVESYYSKKHGESRNKLVAVDYIYDQLPIEEISNTTKSFEDDDIPF